MLHRVLVSTPGSAPGALWEMLQLLKATPRSHLPSETHLYMPGSAGTTTLVLCSRRAEPPCPLGFYEHRCLGSGARICIAEEVSGCKAITFLCQRVASGRVFISIGDHH